MKTICATNLKTSSGWTTPQMKKSQACVVYIASQLTKTESKLKIQVHFKQQGWHYNQHGLGHRKFKALPMEPLGACTGLEDNPMG